ncbi:MAG TPA: glycerol kinase [Gemmatimonadales bacterium]|nr:glycerol kinase [Gemmatimonadales bacterium]
MPAILALDQGTTGTTALVVDQDGSVLGRGYREITQHYPEPGLVEHDAEEILESAVSAMREAVAAAGVQPQALGITNQRETVVVWDRSTLHAVGPAIVWQDRRTSERCRQLREQGCEPLIRERTGLVLDPYFSATKLEWILENTPGYLPHTGPLAFGTVESWLVARLTGGCHVTDHTNASRTLLYNLATRDWDAELLELFGIPMEVMPRIVPSSGIVEETDPDLLGFSIPIAGLAGDQQAALFGQGCVAPGLAKNTYGTGAFLLSYLGETPPPEPIPGILTTAACGPRGEPALALEGSLFIAGAAIQWLRDGLGIIAAAGETERLARSVADTAGVTFVPAFTGLGTPHWEPEARGTITGLTRGTTRAHLVRAALESMAFGTMDLVNAMEPAAPIELLRVDGGASANDWLLQSQADLLGRPVERPDQIETTALGAAALAGIATGVWSSLDEFLASRRFVRFDPGLDEAERGVRKSEWDRAVRAALAWARG